MRIRLAILAMCALAFSASGDMFLSDPAFLARTVQSGAFVDPTSLAGLHTWLKTDAGITLNTNEVSAWADQSGNSNNYQQTTYSIQPTYSNNVVNSLPMLLTPASTAGSMFGVSTQALGSVQNQTLFFVLKPFAAQSSESDFYVASVGAATRGLAAALFGNNGGQIGLSTNATYNFQNFGAPNYDGNTTTIFTIKVSDTYAFVYTNGVLLGSNTFTVYKATTSVKPVIFGNTAAATSAYNLKGFFGDFIVYTNTLSDVNQGKVETYLKTRWGL